MVWYHAHVRYGMRREGRGRVRTGKEKEKGQAGDKQVWTGYKGYI